MKASGERADERGSNEGVSTPVTPPTLTDLGVTRNESSTWQSVATVPEETRAEYVARELAPP